MGVKTILRPPISDIMQDIQQLGNCPRNSRELRRLQHVVATATIAYEKATKNLLKANARVSKAASKLPKLVVKRKWYSKRNGQQCTESWFSRNIMKTYEARYTNMSYEINALKLVKVGVAGETVEGGGGDGPLAIFSYVGWEWPTDAYLGALRKDIRKGCGYRCRVFAECSVETSDDSKTIESWIPKVRYLYGGTTYDPIGGFMCKYSLKEEWSVLNKCYQEYSQKYTVPK